MLPTKAYAAQSASVPLAKFDITRREPGPHDVLIKIAYCGVCHSDIHQARNEWGGSAYPMVPGHEIVGHVERVGNSVTKFKAGDTVGVGCLVDSCRVCESCKEHEEQFCAGGMVGTYNSLERDGKTPTQGGYSSQIVVDENYVLKVSSKLPLEAVAPLLCAGITTYSPLRHWKIKKGDRVAIVGLGGLGHMGVKLAVSMGAEVTVLSTSPQKEADAKKLGAQHFAATSDPATFKKLQGHFNFILDTVSANHDYNQYLSLVAKNGTMCVVGVPTKPAEVNAFSVIFGRKSLAGSLIGGIKETQEMLDYCAEHNIVSDIEIIAMKDINTAYERMLRADVRYRFVIDMKTL